MKKRLILIIITLLMGALTIFGTHFYGADVITLYADTSLTNDTIDNTDVSEFSLTYKVKNNSADNGYFSSFQYMIAYNASIFEYLGFVASPDMDASDVHSGNNYNELEATGWKNSGYVTASNVTLVQMRFKLKENATPGSYSFAILPDNGFTVTLELYNDWGDPITNFNTQNTNVIVTGEVPPDPETIAVYGKTTLANNTISSVDMSSFYIDIMVKNNGITNDYLTAVQMSFSYDTNAFVYESYEASPDFLTNNVHVGRFLGELEFTAWDPTSTHASGIITASDVLIVRVKFKLAPNPTAGVYSIVFIDDDPTVDYILSDRLGDEISGVLSEDIIIRIEDEKEEAFLTALSVKHNGTEMNGTWTTGDMTTTDSIYTISTPIAFADSRDVLINANISSGARLRINGTVVTALGNHNVLLSTGENTISLEVRSSSGTVINNYTIKIMVTEADTNNSISSFVVKNQSATIPGTMTSNVYTVTNQIAYANRNSINLTINTASSLATILINGINANSGEAIDLALTEGIKNIINVSVTSESGSTALYEVHITVENGDSNANLASLKLTYSDNSSIALTPAFNDAITSYEASVEPGTSMVVVLATALSSKASVSGTGNKTVPGTISVIVTAENGTTKTYLITVTRTVYSDDNRINDLSVSGYVISPTFNQTITNYTVMVPYTQSSIQINATKNDQTALLSGVGSWPVAVGNNTFEIYATAQDGTKGVTYTIIVTRIDLPNNNKIINIEVEGYALTPEFSQGVTAYSLTVGNSITAITIKATLSDTLATISGTGNKTLSLGKNPFTIYATAQNGSKGIEYIINITREDLSSDNKITDIRVEGYTLTPEFSQGITAYSLTVDTLVSSVNILATTNDINASLTGAGARSLSLGVNEFRVFATSQNGIKGMVYTITINRSLPGDNKITNIEVEGYQLSPIFHANETNYYLNVPYLISLVNIAVQKSDPLSTIVGSGSKSLSVGANTFVIYATAQNGTKGVEYTVIINRTAPSDNANIVDIILDGHPGFVFNALEETQVYTVAFDISSVVVIVALEDNTATVIGQGSKMLVVGQNELIVLATAQNGTKGIQYKIIITREASVEELSDNASIKDITISNHSIVPNYSSEIREYILTVPYSVVSINVIVLLEHPNAQAVGKGSRTLFVGNNEIIIYAIAQDGTKGLEYKINITRENLPDDNTIISITVGEEILDLTQGFDHTIRVPYTINSVNIMAVANDSLAAVFGTGSKTLVVGNNLVLIYAKSQRGNAGTPYNVNIIREELPDDNIILNIEIDNYPINFEILTTTYNITVPFAIESINIRVIANDPLATVFNQGSKALEVGLNTIEVYVVSQNGNRGTSYALLVTRNNPSNNANITNISVTKSGANPEEYLVFNPSNTEYQFQVPFDVSAVNIIATTEDQRAVLKGIGAFPLVVGVNETYVYAVAQAGNEGTKYKIIIVRETSSSELSDDNEILNILIPDTNFTFDARTYEYTVNVKYSVKYVTVNVSASDPKAQVFGRGSKALTAGVNNTVDVYAISQAGNEGLHYIIHIFREGPSSNNNITNITVDGFIFEFASDIYTYDLGKVSNGVSAIVIFATLENEFSTIHGTGAKGLAVGANSFTVYAKSQSGAEGLKYTITVIRESLDEDTTITQISINGSNLDNFSPLVSSYFIEVPFEITTASVVAITNSPYAVVFGIGAYTLQVGDNPIVVYSRSQSGMIGQTYTIIITRLASSDPILDDRGIKEFIIEGVEFIYLPETLSYGPFVVPNEISSVNVIVSANDSQAIVFGRGIKLLSVGMNTISVYVRSQAGYNSNVYEVVIIRNSLSDNNTISDIKVSGHYLNYNKDVSSYTLNVPFNTSAVTLIVTAEDKRATIHGAGTHFLLAGQNIISVYAISVSGEEGTVYNIYVNRAGAPSGVSNDFDIANILIDGYSNFIFDSKTTEYLGIVLPYPYAAVNIVVTPSDPLATVFGQGVWVLAAGAETKVEIYAVSQAGNQGEKYSIYITRETNPDNENDNNNISDIFIEGYEIDFNMETNVYHLSVEYNISSVNIIVTAEDPLATVFGRGAHKLYGGENNIIIYALAQNGLKGIEYKIVITRLAPQDPTKDNRTLNSLLIDGIPISFDPTVEEYYVEVPFEISAVNLIATANDPYAVLHGIGARALVVGNNVFYVYVESQAGNIGTKYSITVKRKPAISSEVSYDNSLKTIEIEGQSLTFIEGVFVYNLSVPYVINFVNIIALANDNKAVVYGTGTKPLQVGMNVFRIYAISQAETMGDEYTINITRLNRSDVYLQSLEVLGHNLDKEFSPLVTEYFLSIPDSVSTIDIHAILNTSYAGYRVIGSGRYNVDKIENGRYQSILISVVNENNLEDIAIQYLITVQKTKTVNTRISPVFIVLVILTLLIAIAGLVVAIIYYVQFKKAEEEREPKNIDFDEKD